MKNIRLEAMFRLIITASSIEEAKSIINDMRIKHPQTARTIAPEWIGTWEMGTELADADPIGAAIVRADCGPKRRH